jgi:hypothetical protein
MEFRDLLDRILLHEMKGILKELRNNETNGITGRCTGRGIAECVIISERDITAMRPFAVLIVFNFTFHFQARMVYFLSLTSSMLTTVSDRVWT